MFLEIPDEILLVGNLNNTHNVSKQISSIIEVK